MFQGRQRRKRGLYYEAFAFQCSDDRSETGDEEEGVRFAWVLVFKWRGFVWRVGGRPKGNVGTSLFGCAGEYV